MGHLFGDGTMHVYHEFARLQSMTQGWQWLLFAGVCLVVVVYVSLLQRRDSADLPGGLRWLLLVLRLAALAGIVFFFFDLERRSERQLVKNSRALILVDTSLSMGIQDLSPSEQASSPRRIDVVIKELAQGDLIRRLRQDHDVSLYRFDQNDVPELIVSLGKISPRNADPDSAQDSLAARAADLPRARRTTYVAAAVLVISSAGFLVAIVASIRGWGAAGAWTLCGSVLGVLLSVVLLAVADLQDPQIGLLATLGLQPATTPQPTAEPQQGNPDAGNPPPGMPVAWEERLSPRGSETRLGDALRHLIGRERGGPIAGIIVFTDGGSNAGVDCTQVVAEAAEANVPICAVGLGDARRPANIRVADLEAPPRVYPGDSFPLTGYVQSFGFAGRTVQVELLSASDSATPGSAPDEVQEERRVTLGQDGEIVPVRFEVPPSKVGRRSYQVRVAPPQQDHDPRDNARSANVEVVQRKNRVLLFAGGPTREFVFLRNLLHRDRDTTVDVFLQTGRPGMSQDASQIWFEFPKLAAQLFEYDALVAFDPDWLALDEQQLQLLERWVAEEAGGLIVVAGPVHTPQWTHRPTADSRLEIVKGLYPVVFYGRASATLSTGRFASEAVWPLQLTREGQDAEFLWLEDDAPGSQAAWAAFEGVYGYYAVKDPKAGTHVYARFTDPSTALDGELPIYLAAHFYGAGRVFFQASGEMWRLRAVDEAFFERYYTKLIRWVSQGRLLRDSTRGVLLVDKEKCLLGDQIAVRAILTDAQFLPLTAGQITATLVHPDGRRSNITMARALDAAREGQYAGDFTALSEGDYRVELPSPHGGDLLAREVRARIPALETEHPERNDALLRDLADKAGGAYYVGMDAALSRGNAGRPPIASRLVPQDQVTYLTGSPDLAFERLLMKWLMTLIGGCLCLEWLIRRLAKLA